MLRSTKYLGRAGQLVFQSVANGQPTADTVSTEAAASSKNQKATCKPDEHGEEGGKKEQQQRKPGQQCWLGDNPGLFMAIGGSLAAGHQVAQLIFDRPDQELEAADELEEVLRPTQPWCTWRHVARTAIAQPMLSLAPHISHNVLAQSSGLASLLHRRPSAVSREISVQTDSQDDILAVEEATTRMSKAINKCEAAVTNGIGVDLMRRGLDAEAVDRFERAANTSVEHASASYNLGLCHAFGRGTHKDMNKAVESWKVAVAHGHAGASYQLGVCHVRGLGGLVADAQLGASMIRVAAEAAVPEAQLYVGLLLLKEGDLEGAFALIKAAADAKNAQAIALLKRYANDASSAETSQKKKKLPVRKRSVSPVSKRDLTKLWANASEDENDSVCFASADEDDDNCSSSSWSDKKQEMHKASTVADFRPLIMQQHVASRRQIQEF